MGMSGATRYRGVEALLGAQLLQPRTPHDRDLVVTRRHGLAASVYAVWEVVSQREPDGATYRRMNGRVWRKVGSALLSLDDLFAPDAAQSAYQAEYGRAYAFLYRLHPSLRGIGEEREGEIVVRAPLNDWFL